MNNRTYITPDWPAPKNIRAYTSTRQHGFSKAPYASFNLSHAVNDDPESVTANVDALSNDLQLPETPTWLHQVHGNRAVRIEEYQTTVKADASFTQMNNKVCAILTADCLPVLICNRAGTEIAAIHAGWRGLLVNVIAASIQSLYSSPDDLIAWLGPALGPDHFDVGHAVYADFLNTHPDYRNGFIRHHQAWHLDCYAMARQQLQDAGVNAIYGGGLCTFDDKERFYSYRRDKGTTGRMASLLFIS